MLRFHYKSFIIEKEKQKGNEGRMSLRKDYKQYFTPHKLAKYMVSIIPEKIITNVIDLSMGECGLLEAAKERWKDAKLYGVDIDKALIKKIRTKSPYIHTFHGDSLSHKLDGWKEYKDVVTGKGFDLAIANPPFNYFDQKYVFVQDGQRYLLPIEMRFLLKYIDIVHRKGYVCIILPYSFLSSDSYTEFRMELLKKVEILKIVKIFDGCFERIDAGTCLILMKKKDNCEKNMQGEICIEYLDNNYNVCHLVHANIELNKRWDIEYQDLQEKNRVFENNSQYTKACFGRYIYSCRRGRTITKHKEFVCEKGKRYIHTTDVKKLYIDNHAPRFVNNDTHYFDDAFLHEKELVVGRVGRGCIGKVAIVHKKYPRMAFSDCIFAICLQDVNPYYMALFLAADIGQSQLKGASKGSCSRYITRGELSSITVFIPDAERQEQWAKQYMHILSQSGRADKEKLLHALAEKLDEDIRKKG